MDKPTAWYDPSNGMVSTDRDCPLFTPLGQVWALYPKGEWVGLTRMQLIKCGVLPFGMSYELYKAIEAKLKERNT